MIWQLAEAKNKFSEVLDRASEEGPQIVTRRKKRYIIIEEEEYQRATGKQMGFLDYLRSGPNFDGVEIERDKSPMRDLDLW